MSRGAEKWAALNAGMGTHTPECIDDPRFTDDTTPAAEVVEICDDCPLSALCAAYASTTRPLGGIWAGKRYSSKSSKVHLSPTNSFT